MHAVAHRTIHRLLAGSGLITAAALVAVAAGSTSAAVGATSAAVHAAGAAPPACAAADGLIADGSAFAEMSDVSAFGVAFAESSLAPMLAGRGPFTVFAPSDEAFGAIEPTVWQTLLNDPSLLSSVVASHVVWGRAYDAEQLVAASPIAATNRVDLVAKIGTGDGGRLVVSVPDTATGAGVVCVAEFSDGIVYVLDAVLQPPVGACAPAGVPGSSVPGDSVPGSSVPVPSGSTPGSSLPGVVC